MTQMNKHYESEFKKKIVRLHLEEGRNPQGSCCRIRRIQGEYIHLGKAVPRRMPDK